MNKFYLKTFLISSICLLIFSTTFAQDGIVKTYRIVLKTATDIEYPNNNMIGFKSKYDGVFSHKEVLIQELVNGNFDFIVLPGNPASDTLFINNINLLEMLPTIPAYTNKDAYLSYLAVLNQEWNRIQVKFNNKQYKVRGEGTEIGVITRIDIANNCLAKGLWEILTFTTDNNNDQLYFQCWFDFPETLYNQLFLKRNKQDIDDYNDILKNYTNRAGEPLNLKKLRKVNSEKSITFSSLNHEYYPLKGERETKLKNIVSPTRITTINDLLTDQTTFATFAAPGQYTRTDPRKTMLSRFQQLEKVSLSQTVSTNTMASISNELQFYFTDNNKKTHTRYIIGGLQLDKLPLLNASTLHKGWQRPMGIANHSFYNTYDDIIAASSAQSPYFSFLIDENGKWLDSHNVGIDGILMYRDEADISKVHALILSFERHAFVGHFVLDIPVAKPIAVSGTTEDKKLSFYADMRSRILEDDWHVTTESGKILDPRARMRLRLRFGFNYQYSPTLSFGGRIRTGSANEQQSPHITLGSNEDANIMIGLDRAFIKYSSKNFTAWTGKNTFPFYTCDDLFVTQDISPEGLFGSYKIKVGKNFNLRPSAAFFIINSNGKSLKRDGNMKAFQLWGNLKNGSNELNLSTGIFLIDSVGNTPDGTKSFILNYHEMVSSMKFTYGKWKIPVSLSGNLMLNTATLQDSIIRENNLQDQKVGYSATLEFGGLKAKKDYLLSITYAHIEKYAVLDYFAQDDWMRWGFSGGAGGTRGSNFKGFEFRAAYAFGANCNLVARMYLIEGVAKNNSTATIETNNRFRLDLNVGF